MQTLEQFIAEQNAALEKKRQEIAEFETIGPVPGLDPWLIYGRLYGSRHVGYKLRDMGEFIQWARENCIPVHAVEGIYKGFYPHVPDTRDYKDSRIVASGDVEVSYSTITRAFTVMVFIDGFRLSFEIKRHVSELTPRAVMRSYSDRYHGERRVESWYKTGAGVRQYLRVSVDKQSADLETLLTWEQFIGYFGEVM